ncbi:MAG: trypsin-like peptidase domain-containing protein [Candidatus Eisenbacteria bacterium]|uniref:Trypsin-like peptidase domain-containing protein n=1 Tax=Eiseniibacteriota bacterium TaxID=2212470 RepID=A0A948RU57_UNCEI|nr:trypsin-like peptidase domain-containing protein [Candidatus Eisenbacteria bacterium]MBU1948542.1 trypsin-like peptidase domain-containing protein [Candidatus Eisenbacteria bacterium]MBU2691068.1 trypsin-like peptidase domain-containing protein [Candidatus Eisenbacteria bacterium]
MFRKLGITLTLIILGLFAFQTADADLDAQQRQHLYYSVKPAVVLVWLSVQAQITIQTEQGPIEMQTQMSSSGSGWIISADGYLVTNGHVVDTYHDNNDEQLKSQMLWRALEENVFPGAEQKQGRPLTSEEKVALFQQFLSAAEISVKKDLDVYLQNWKKYSAEVKEFSPPMSGRPGKTSIPWESWETGKDVAVLKIEGRDLPTVRIGDSGTMQIGAAVHVAGYPGVVMEHTYLNPESVLEASFTTGQISSLKLDVKGSNVLQFDAPVTWGNSGGPVFNDNGDVIGMATFISIHQGQQAIQGFNFAVPSNVVKEFIRAAGVDTSPSLFDRAWADALNLYYQGKSQEAIAKFTEVLRLMPDLQDATKLQREAMSGGGGGESGGFSTTTLIIGLVVLIGIILIVTGIMRTRRGGGAAAVAKKPKAGADLGQLVVQTGPLKGNTFPITVDGIRIGRDAAKCQIVINEETVSREHAIVFADNAGAIMVKNLSGTNPTHVNERSIQETTMQPGDTIKVGSSVMVYRKG